MDIMCAIMHIKYKYNHKKNSKLSVRLIIVTKMLRRQIVVFAGVGKKKKLYEV